MNGNAFKAQRIQGSQDALLLHGPRAVATCHGPQGPHMADWLADRLNVLEDLAEAARPAQGEPHRKIPFNPMAILAWLDRAERAHKAASKRSTKPEEKRQADMALDIYRGLRMALFGQKTAKDFEDVSAPTDE